MTALSPKRPTENADARRVELQILQFPRDMPANESCRWCNGSNCDTDTLPILDLAACIVSDPTHSYAPCTACQPEQYQDADDRGDG